MLSAWPARARARRLVPPEGAQSSTSLPACAAPLPGPGKGATAAVGRARGPLGRLRDSPKRATKKWHFIFAVYRQ